MKITEGKISTCTIKSKRLKLNNHREQKEDTKNTEIMEDEASKIGLG